MAASQPLLFQYLYIIEILMVARRHYYRHFQLRRSFCGSVLLDEPPLRNGKFKSEGIAEHRDSGTAS